MAVKRQLPRLSHMPVLLGHSPPLSLGPPSRALSPGPCVCVQLHDKAPWLLQDTRPGSPATRTAVGFCPSPWAPLVHMGSDLLLISPLYIYISFPTISPCGLQGPASDVKTTALQRVHNQSLQLPEVESL